MPKVYISGPTSGMDKLNEEAFTAAASELSKRGFEVVNPHDVKPTVENPQYNDFMRADLKAMLDCDAIYMLRGWQDCRGANIEYDLAVKLNFETIIFQTN